MLTDPGTATKANEDLFDGNGDAAWIFDGATALGNRTLTSAGSDPFWLVQTLNSAIKTSWNSALPTKEILQKSVELTAAQFRAETGIYQPAPEDMPSACLLMIRLLNGRLELSTIGDCVLVRHSGDIISTFGGVIEALEVPVLKAIRDLQARGLDRTEIKAQLLQTLREIRATANQPGGYAIIDLTTRWLDAIKIETIDIDPGDRFLLMSDGFERLISIFGRYDAARLLAAVETRGLAALNHELRQIEATGMDTVFCFKDHDDSTAALIEIVSA